MTDPLFEDDTARMDVSVVSFLLCGLQESDSFFLNYILYWYWIPILVFVHLLQGIGFPAVFCALKPLPPGMQHSESRNLTACRI